MNSIRRLNLNQYAKHLIEMFRPADLPNYLTDEFIGGRYIAGILDQIESQENCTLSDEQIQEVTETFGLKIEDIHQIRTQIARLVRCRVMK